MSGDFYQLSSTPDAERRMLMSVAKVIEISSQHPKSFEDAIAQGIRRAAETVHDIKAAWIAEQQVEVTNGKISGYRVNLRVTFILDGNGKKGKGGKKGRR
jgi:flavin-binding protein dodecin